MKKWISSCFFKIINTCWARILIFEDIVSVMEWNNYTLLNYINKFLFVVAWFSLEDRCSKPVSTVPFLICFDICCMFVFVHREFWKLRPHIIFYIKLCHLEISLDLTIYVCTFWLLKFLMHQLLIWACIITYPMARKKGLIFSDTCYRCNGHGKC